MGDACRFKSLSVVGRAAADAADRASKVGTLMVKGFAVDDEDEKPVVGKFRGRQTPLLYILVDPGRLASG